MHFWGITQKKGFIDYSYDFQTFGLEVRRNVPLKAVTASSDPFYDYISFPGTEHFIHNDDIK